MPSYPLPATASAWFPIPVTDHDASAHLHETPWGTSSFCQIFRVDTAPASNAVVAAVFVIELPVTETPSVLIHEMECVTATDV